MTEQAGDGFASFVMKRGLPPRPEIVHEHAGHWWFWNETWSDREGPYISQAEAASALKNYVANVLGYDRNEV